MGDMTLDYVCCILIPKHNAPSETPNTDTPQLEICVDPEHFIISPNLNFEAHEIELSKSSYLFDDYGVGEKIDRMGCMTTEEVEYMMAARLYQNPSQIYVNQQLQKNLFMETVWFLKGT